MIVNKSDAVLFSCYEAVEIQLTCKLREVPISDVSEVLIVIIPVLLSNIWIDEWCALSLSASNREQV